ncbi:hypothetical protein HPB50_010135 [Hyalomma asiaticum]|uniref:Uncharacterized protein n=1 Tax=Hyalomma asiaticum TaxID=266040 RepID=A0ACB7SPU6_HYAAI|nr:hypothetical protein HPB50_010135 [Hyalomma asiaticum]
MTAGLRPEDGSWARDTLSFGSGGREEARMNEGGPQLCARPDASLPAPPVATTSDDNGQATPDKKPRRQHRPMDIAAPRRTTDISAVSRVSLCS